MNRTTEKLVVLADREGEAYAFHCPGCEMTHVIPVRYTEQFKTTSGGKLKPTWRFNGDLYKPTFVPHFEITWEGAKRKQHCHVIVRDGELIYLIGSTHKLSGQRLQMG